MVNKLVDIISYSLLNPAKGIAKKNIEEFWEMRVSAWIEGEGEPKRYLSGILKKTLLDLNLVKEVDLGNSYSKKELELFNEYKKNKVKPKVLLVVDMDGVMGYPIADLFKGKDFNKLGIPDEQEINLLLKLAEAGVPVYLWTSRFQIEDQKGWWSDLKEKVAGWFTMGKRSAFPFVDPEMEAELNWESGGNLKLWAGKNRENRNLETILSQHKDVDYWYYIGSSPTDDGILREFLTKYPKEKKRMTYIRIPQLFL